MLNLLFNRIIDFYFQGVIFYLFQPASKGALMVTRPQGIMENVSAKVLNVCRGPIAMRANIYCGPMFSKGHYVPKANISSCSLIPKKQYVPVSNISRGSLYHKGQSVPRDSIL
jgi:hypothetical protein